VGYISATHFRASTHSRHHCHCAPGSTFHALGAGAGALLEKPMDIPTLLRTMAKLLAESAEQKLARLVGMETEFHYKAATTLCECSHPAKRH